MTPETRGRLVAEHSLKRAWALHDERCRYEIAFLEDYLTPITEGLHQRLFPIVAEHREKCGCVDRTLRNGWTLRVACWNGDGHGYKRGDFYIADETGEVLSWASTMRRAIQDAYVEARRPKHGPNAIRIEWQGPRACRCTEYRLACGWFMVRRCCTAHGRDPYEVLEPGGTPDGNAAVRAFGETKRQALKRTLEALELRYPLRGGQQEMSL